MKRFFLAGHKKNQELLTGILHQRALPEAFLFYGPEKLSQLTLAKMFSLSLILGVPHLAEHEIDHPDLKILTLDETSKFHSIAKIKEFIEDMYLPPYQGKKKVFLIDEAHKMQPAASNALLKTLEEPALASVMILLAPSLAQVLPTISSRCCKMNFSPLSLEEISEDLIQNHGLDLSQAKDLAYDSLGSLEYAYMLLKKPGAQWKNVFFDLLSNPMISYEDQMHKIAELEKILESEGAVGIEYFFDFILKLFRDIALLQEGLDVLVYFQNQIKTLKTLSVYCLGGLDYFSKIIEEMMSGYFANVKLKSCLEIFFLRIYQQNAGLKAFV
jgi:DNA polymerase-3 subunit delta'